MQRRPIGDSPEEQLLKGQAHKHARETLKHYENTKNHIGAYVIIFSLFEDRIRALCVLHNRDVKKIEYKEKIASSLTKIISGLKKDKVLPKDVYVAAFELARKRNALIHEALYSLNAFTKEHVVELKLIEKQLDAIRRKLKRRIAADAKSQST